MLNSREEDALTEALAGMEIWRHKYNTVLGSRVEYRDIARKLMVNNESLQSTVNQVSSVCGSVGVANIIRSYVAW